MLSGLHDGDGGRFNDAAWGGHRADYFDVVVLWAGEIDKGGSADVSAGDEGPDEGAVDAGGIRADNLCVHVVGEKNIGADRKEADGVEQRFNNARVEHA